MVFVNSAGEVQATRTWFRFGVIVELFWSIINFIGLFFSTLFGDARSKVKQPVNRAEAPFRPRGTGGGGGGGGGKGPYIRGFKDLNNKGGGAVPGGCCGGSCPS